MLQCSNAVVVNNLSAIGSKNFPKSVTSFLLLANCPSRMSVSAAKQKYTNINSAKFKLKIVSIFVRFWNKQDDNHHRYYYHSVVVICLNRHIIPTFYFYVKNFLSFVIIKWWVYGGEMAKLNSKSNVTVQTKETSIKQKLCLFD